MAALNITPDSFYAGARVAPADAAHKVASLVAEGAEIIDLGAESSRPGSVPVSAPEQIARLAAALGAALAQPGVLVSVDTASAEVAEYALGRGAHIINDVSCLRETPLAQVTARFDAVLILMHSRAPMSAHEGFSHYADSGYNDVIEDVRREWLLARDRACSEGMKADRIWFDPGIGFNKNARQSFEILRRFSAFRELGVPLVLGPSRKSFIAAVDAVAPEQRLGGTIAACLQGVQLGANVLRVHDVAAVHQALVVDRTIRDGLGQHA